MACMACKNLLASRKTCDIFAPFWIPHGECRGFLACSGESRDKTGGGSRLMGLGLLVVIWLLTLVGSYFIIAKAWRLPVGASAAAAGIGHHFTTSSLPLGAVLLPAHM